MLSFAEQIQRDHEDVALLQNWLCKVVLPELRQQRNCKSQKSNVQRLAKLSTRRRQVLNEVLQGKCNKRIAIDLDVTVRTIEQTIRSIYQVLGVKSRSELFMFICQTYFGVDRLPQIKLNGESEATGIFV